MPINLCLFARAPQTRLSPDEESPLHERAVLDKRLRRKVQVAPPALARQLPPLPDNHRRPRTHLRPIPVVTTGRVWVRSGCNGDGTRNIAVQAGTTATSGPRGPDSGHLSRMNQWGTARLVRQPGYPWAG